MFGAQRFETKTFVSADERVDFLKILFQLRHTCSVSVGLRCVWRWRSAMVARLRVWLACVVLQLSSTGQRRRQPACFAESRSRKTLINLKEVCVQHDHDEDADDDRNRPHVTCVTLVKTLRDGVEPELDLLDLVAQW